MPLDFVSAAPETAKSSAAKSSAKAVSTTSSAEILDLILKELRDNIEAAQIEQTAEANRHRRPHPFQIGESVFLDTRDFPLEYANSSTESRKLQHKSVGPFTIVASYGNAMRLDTPAHWRMRTFNVSRLSPDSTDKSRPHDPPRSAEEWSGEKGGGSYLSPQRTYIGRYPVPSALAGSPGRNLEAAGAPEGRSRGAPTGMPRRAQLTGVEVALGFQLS